MLYDFMLVRLCYGEYYFGVGYYLDVDSTFYVDHLRMLYS